jgi:hypothetical protein
MREIRDFGSPISKGRSETVRGDIASTHAA